jgi:dihydrofolate synthase/folylpolyglutamate synthase
MLAAVLQESGYKTGLYTSPHIHDFRERIRINGEMVSEEFILHFVASISEICKEIEPSFFEVSVAMAFEYFATQHIDIAVIETGLGGRLDSTNIITPLLSIITSIGLDHTDLLGDTLDKIAREKAGIIKPDVPVILGDAIDEVAAIFRQVAGLNRSNYYFAAQELQIEYIESTDFLLICHIKDPETGIVEKLQLDLTGLYQVYNARTVVAAVKQLRKKIFIPEEALHKGLCNVRKLTGIFGRWEIIGSKPTIVLDVAHNKDGLTQIISQLHNNHPSSKYHFVLGFVKDKNTDNLFDIFPDNSLFYFTQAHIPRALPHLELKAVAESQGKNGESFDDVNNAIIAAKNAASPEDMIIVCGSFFVISEVRL